MKTCMICLLGMVCLWVPIVSIGQDLDIVWGENISSDNFVLKILGDDENGHYALATRKKAFFLEYYEGENMQRAFSTELEFPKDGRLEAELGNIFYLDGNLVLFTIVFDKPNKLINIYGYNLDEKGKISSDRVDIASIKVERNSRSGQYGITFSRDESKILVYHSAPYKKGDLNEWRVTMKVMTNTLQVIKDAVEVFPLDNDDADIHISNFFVGNDAAFFMAASERTLQNYSYITRTFTIYQYAPENAFEVQEIPVEIGGKVAQEIALTDDADGNLIGAGFYAEPSGKLFSYDGLAGSFFIRIDRWKAQVSDFKTAPFGPAFAETILSEKKAAKGKMVPNLFIPVDVINKTDGGVILTAEYYLQTVAYSQGTRTISTTHGPIVVVSMDGTGEIDWVNSIPKKQVYSDAQLAILFVFADFGAASFGSGFWLSLTKDQSVYHSFLTGIKGNDLYLVYNDHPKNGDIKHYKETKTLSGFKKASLQMVVIDQAGNMTKTTLAERDKEEVVLRPGIYFQDSYDEILIYGSRKKKEKFGRILFE